MQRIHDTQLTVRLATSDADLQAVQRLRYDVFVSEGGADGAQVDHAARLETDRFDAHADHLLLIDRVQPAGAQVVGTYRLMTRAHAQAAGGFYAADEFLLDKLTNQPAGILELGRSCLAPAYRGGTALLKLWQGIGRYVAAADIEILFGTASFWGTDPAEFAAPLSLLHHAHLAPEALRVKAHGAGAVAMNMITPSALDRRAAMTQVPALIKSYLRLGGAVGAGAYVDRAFGTIDVCLILETDKLSARQTALYGGGDAA